jgi:hypothetical protein
VGQIALTAAAGEEEGEGGVMSDQHSVRTVYMICRNEQKEYLSESGAWTAEHGDAALFDTEEEAEAHCPAEGCLVSTELVEPLIPLALDELIAILQGLRAKHGGDVPVVFTNGDPIAKVSFDTETASIVMAETEHEDAWVESDDDEDEDD